MRFVIEGRTEVLVICYIVFTFNGIRRDFVLVDQRGGHIVLGRNSNEGTNGGVTIAYQYSGIALGGNGDELALSVDIGGPIVDVDYFAYTTASFDTAGRSQQLDANFTLGDNSDETNWCDTRDQAPYLLPGGDHAAHLETPRDYMLKVMDAFMHR